MKNLIYKDLTLSINKFFFFLPVLLGALMFIPGWIFTLVFMYFFWISVSQIFAAFNTNADYDFTTSLPVRRQDIVRSRIYAIYIVEVIHLLFGLIFGLIHNQIYGTWNFFFDINFSFFGLMILLYGIFNVVFFPMYFRTAHFFGKPAIYGNIAALAYGFVLEFGIVKYQFMRDIFEGSITSQILPFTIATLLGIGLSIFAVKRSQTNFKKIDL